MSHLHRSTPFKAKGMANGVAGAGVGPPHENGFLLAHTNTIEEIPMDVSPRHQGECRQGLLGLAVRLTNFTSASGETERCFLNTCNINRLITVLRKS